MSNPMPTVTELERKNVILVQDGNHGESRPRRDEFCDEGVAFIRAADLDNGEVLFASASRINPTARARITKGIGRPGDVILSHKGTVGKIARAGADAPAFVCSPQTTFWRSLDSEVLDQTYLYVFLRSPVFKSQLNSRSGETDMAPYVSLTAQRTFTVTLPPIDQQRVIASVIGSLDDKIELNRRMNETIEASARALFRDWFVDFGPTRAKMAGTAPYLAPDIWSLFPNSFDDEGKPVGWDQRPLDQIADFLNGLALQKYPAKPDSPSLPVIKIAELRSGITGNSNHASTDVPAKYIIEDGDFLFSWSGSLLAKFWTEGRGALNQHLFKVSSDEFPAWFYSQWVWHHLEEFQRIAASKATTMGHIQRGHLTAAQTVCPPSNVIEALGKTMKPLLDQIIANQLQSRTLAETRDALLPKLMSGEIRVTQAEKVAGDKL